MLPQENRRGDFPLLDEVREHNGASRHAPVVIADESGGASENCGDGQDDAPHRSGSRRNVPPQRPPKKRRAQGNEKNSPFDGPADGKNTCSQTENNRVSRALVIPDSRQRSQDQGGPSRRHRAAPIAVHPVAEHAEARPNQHAAEQRPFRRHPSLQHPGEGHAHRGDAQQHADPRMAEQFSDGQRHSLRRGIHRRVRRMLDDVKRVEKNPQRMRRIRQPPVSERVRGKQVAELVVNFGLRHGQPRQERHSRKDRDRANGHYGEPLVPRELGKLSLHPGQIGSPNPGLGQTRAKQTARIIQSSFDTTNQGSSRTTQIEAIPSASCYCG